MLIKIGFQFKVSVSKKAGNEKFDVVCLYSLDDKRFFQEKLYFDENQLVKGKQRFATFVPQQLQEEGEIRIKKNYLQNDVLKFAARPSI